MYTLWLAWFTHIQWWEFLLFWFYEGFILYWLSSHCYLSNTCAAESRKGWLAQHHPSSKSHMSVLNYAVQKTLTHILKPTHSETFLCCNYVYEKQERKNYIISERSMPQLDFDSFFFHGSCHRRPVNRKSINLTSEKKAIERRWCRVERVERERRVNWRNKMSDLYRLYYSLLCLCLLSPPSALTDSFRPV